VSVRDARDPFGDGVAFGLPTLEQSRASARAARALTVQAARRAKPWPEQRTPAPLYSNGYTLAMQIAIQLARDLDTCAALLLGEPVDPSRLNAAVLEWAKRHMLFRLDFRAIDLLARRKAAA